MKKKEAQPLGAEVTSGPRVPDLLPHELEQLKPLLAKVGAFVQFDACIVGVGERNEFGEVVALRCLCENVPHEFLDRYGEVAEHDAAAQLFSSHATSVLSVSPLDDYPFDTKESGKVGAYLRKHGVAQLLLCGVNSSRGLAWATFFRLDPGAALASAPSEMSERDAQGLRDRVRPSLPGAFSPQEAETASYLVRGGLYEWQLACAFPLLQAPDPERYQMIPLSPQELDVALRRARGYKDKEIRYQLSISRSEVDNRVAKMTAQGLTATAVARRLLGPLPPPRLDKGPRRGPRPTSPAAAGNEAST